MHCELRTFLQYDIKASLLLLLALQGQGQGEASEVFAFDAKLQGHQNLSDQDK